MLTKTVWFIRHAQSEANSELPTNQPSEIRLTPLGKAQAQHLAQCFVESPFLIVTSPFSRTKETAEPTCQRFPTVRCEEWPIEEFTYLEPSRYVGTTAVQRRPMVQAYWDRSDPFYVDGRGAESFA